LFEADALKKTISFVLIACGVIALPWTKIASTNAATAVVWQSTFNCNEWDQTMGLTSAQMNCDQMSGYGSWVTSGHPSGDQITLAANNPAGSGGRGFRHWRADGTNGNGGGMSIHPPASFTEFWMRFYMRYQAGFQWSLLNYTKDLYVHSGSIYTLGFHNSNNFGVSIISPSTNVFGSYGWQSTMGSAVSDGQFHCFETHLKTGTVGIAESWIDGNLVESNLAVNWGATTPWQDIEVGDNQASPNNGTEMYTDYDDFAISVSGRIGCLSGGTSTPPSAPTGLRIQ
jgi:hypothetical protein